MKFLFDRHYASKSCGITSTLLRVEVLEARDVPSDESAGANGVNARNLGLDGQGILIGQIEHGRVGKPGFDSATNSHTHVVPAGVYAAERPAVANRDVAGHGVGVAGIMIANGPTNKGIATGSQLHAATVISDTNIPPDVPAAIVQTLLTTQAVADPKGGVPVRAINVSLALSPVDINPRPPFNGSHIISAGVDHIANKRDTLFVVSKENDTSPQSFPSDAYNILTVGRLNGANYDRAAETNLETATDGRRLIHVLAPGQEIETTVNMPGGPGRYDRASGTSFATPHVTGTAALLHEYAQQNLARLGAPAQQHEVIKAVIMNSAEKVAGRLGSSKTVTKTNQSTWDQSDARDDAGNPGGRAIPLDAEMGVGAVDAKRAKEQLSQRSTFTRNPVKPVAWDWDAVATGDLAERRYRLPRLKGESWLSTTLTWDRVVNLTDNPGGTAGRYDSGESFEPMPLANLDLYLMPRGETDLTKNVWSSISTMYNLEHIFFRSCGQCGGVI